MLAVAQALRLGGVKDAFDSATKLANGAVSSKELFEHAKEAGISKTTLQRAAKRIGVLIFKQGFEGGWAWSFPSAPNDFQRLIVPKMAKITEDRQQRSMGIFEAGWPSSHLKEDGS